MRKHRLSPHKWKEICTSLRCWLLTEWCHHLISLQFQRPWERSSKTGEHSLSYWLWHEIVKRNSTAGCRICRPSPIRAPTSWLCRRALEAASPSLQQVPTCRDEAVGVVPLLGVNLLGSSSSSPNSFRIINIHSTYKSTLDCPDCEKIQMDLFWMSLMREEQMILYLRFFPTVLPHSLGALTSPWLFSESIYCW